jgi:hypothetical protein
MLLKLSQILELNESRSYSINDLVWIHFPITEDLIQCQVKKVTNTKLLLSIPETSDYYGAPDFYFNRLNIIGKV